MLFYFSGMKKFKKFGWALMHFQINREPHAPFGVWGWFQGYFYQTCEHDNVSNGIQCIKIHIYTKLIGMVENLKFIRMIVCVSVVKFHFHWQHVAANDVIKVDNFDFMQYAWNAKLEYWRTMRIASHSLWYWIQFVIIVWSNSVSDWINLLARFSKAKQL